MSYSSTVLKVPPQLMIFLSYSAMSRALNYPTELFHISLGCSFIADNGGGRNSVD